MSDGRSKPALWLNDEDIKRAPYGAAEDWLVHAEMFPHSANEVPVKILKAILVKREGIFK